MRSAILFERERGYISGEIKYKERLYCTRGAHSYEMIKIFSVIVITERFERKQKKFIRFRLFLVIPKKYTEIQTKTDKYKRILRVFCKNHSFLCVSKKNEKIFKKFPKNY